MTERNDFPGPGDPSAPTTDAADPAGDESSSRTTENSSPLNAGADSEPYVQSDGRANSAAGS